MAFYDGNKLLNLKDINGNTPAIYLSAGNRSLGKTTFFNKKLIDWFLKKNEKFLLLYRFKKELTSIDEKFFSDISELFFPNKIMRCVGSKDEPYKKLLLNDELCGFATAINAAEDIKKCSHVFSDVATIMLDEFQSETNHYVNDEIDKYISIYKSVARGKGKQNRYVRCILAGNHVSLLNPYYNSLGISERLRKDTKYLRGDGYVAHIAFDKEVSEESKNTAFDKAFKNARYTKFATDLVYLNDNTSMIKKKEGNSRYVASLYAPDGSVCGVWMTGKNEYHITKEYDKTHPVAVASNRTIIYANKVRSDALLVNIRSQFDKGMVYFDGLESKNRAISTLSY